MKLNICTLFILSCLIGCKNYIYDPECENFYTIKYKYSLTAFKGHMKLGDTLKLSCSIPLDVYNYSTMDTTNIKQFDRILIGLQLLQIEIINSNLTTTGARDRFKLQSTNVNLDTREGVGTRPNSRVRFELKKTNTMFIASLNIIPLKKGNYYIKTLDGEILDACGFTSLRSSWDNYATSEIINDFENMLGRPIDGSLRNRNPSEWQTELYFSVN